MDEMNAEREGNGIFMWRSDEKTGEMRTKAI